MILCESKDKDKFYYNPQNLSISASKAKSKQGQVSLPAPTSYKKHQEAFLSQLEPEYYNPVVRSHQSCTQRCQILPNVKLCAIDPDDCLKSRIFSVQASNQEIFDSDDIKQQPDAILKFIQQVGCYDDSYQDRIIPHELQSSISQISAQQIAALDYSGQNTVTHVKRPLIKKIVGVKKLPQIGVFLKEIAQKYNAPINDFQVYLQLYTTRKIEQVDKNLSLKSINLLEEVLPEALVPMNYLTNEYIALELTLDPDQIYILQLSAFLTGTRVTEFLFQFKGDQEVSELSSIHFEYTLDVQLTEKQKQMNMDQKAVVKTDILLEFYIQAHKPDPKLVNWNTPNYIDVSLPLHLFSQQFQLNGQTVPFPSGTVELFWADKNGKQKKIAQFPHQINGFTDKISYQINDIANMNIMSMTTKTQINSFMIRNCICTENIQQGDCIVVCFRSNFEHVGAFCREFKQMVVPSIQQAKGDTISVQNSLSEPARDDFCFCYGSIGIFGSNGANKPNRMYNLNLIGGQPVFKAGKGKIRDYADNTDDASIPACMNYNAIASQYMESDENQTVLLPFTLPIQIINNFTGVTPSYDIKNQSLNQLTDKRLITKDLNELVMYNSFMHQQNMNEKITKILQNGGALSEDEFKQIHQLIDQVNILQSILSNLDTVFKQDPEMIGYMLCALKVPCFLKMNDLTDLKAKLLSQSIQYGVKQLPIKYYTLNTVGMFENLVKYERFLQSKDPKEDVVAKICQNFTAEMKLSILSKMAVNIDEFCQKFYINSNADQINSKAIQDPTLKSLCKRNLDLDRAGYLMTNFRLEDFEKILAQLINCQILCQQLIIEKIKVQPSDVSVKLTKQNTYNSLDEFIISLMQKASFIITLVCSVMQCKDEVCVLLQQHYPDAMQFNFNSHSFKDVLKLIFAHIEMLKMINGSAPQFVNPIISVVYSLESASDDELKEFLDFSCTNLHNLALMNNDVAVQLVLQVLVDNLYVENNFPVLLNFCNLVSRNQTIQMLSGITAKVFKGFFDYGLILTVREDNEQERTHILQTFCQLKKLDVAKINVDALNYVSMAYVIFKLNMTELYQDAIEVVSKKLQVSKPCEIADEKFCFVLDNLMKLVFDTIKIQIESKQINENMISNSQKIAQLCASDDLVYFFYKQTLANITKTEVVQVAIQFYCACIRQLKFTTHLGQQIMFVLSEYVTFSQIGINEDSMRQITSQMLVNVKEVKTARQVFQLVERYINVFFKLQKQEDLINQLIVPFKQSTLKSLTTVEVKGLAIDSNTITTHVIKQIETDLLDFVDLLKTYNDPRVHFCLDCLFVLYFQQDNPKCIGILDQKQRLVNDGCPDIYIILNLILNQRHQLTMQKDIQPSSFPVDGYPYPNYYIQNGVATVRELFIQYISEFRSNAYLILEDFLALHDFYKQQYCYISQLNYQPVYLTSYVDVQANYSNLINSMQYFLDVQVQSLPISLINLRSGVVNSTKTQNSKQLLQLINKTIRLEKPYEIQNFALNFQYFTNGKQYAEVQTRQQEICRQKVNKLQTLPYICKDDLQCFKNSFGGLVSLIFEVMKSCLQKFKNFAQLVEQINEFYEIEEATTLFIGLFPTAIPNIDVCDVVIQKFTKGYIDENYYCGADERDYLIIQDSKQTIKTVTQNDLLFKDIADMCKKESSKPFAISPIVGNSSIMGDYIVTVQNKQECELVYKKIEDAADVSSHFYKEINIQLQQLLKQCENQANLTNVLLQKKLLTIVDNFFAFQHTKISIQNVDKEFEKTNKFKLIYAARPQNRVTIGTDEEIEQKQQELDVLRKQNSKYLTLINTILNTMSDVLVFLGKSRDEAIQQMSHDYHAIFGEITNEKDAISRDVVHSITIVTNEITDVVKTMSKAPVETQESEKKTAWWKK
ncbi:Conserved_hypothetical protein [Hexamita inflata]|uniref:Uncharacterized protein n=1 Tax=Hexamita inflata TaxID=28002 RepID=A0ABP1GSF2_9EUKA